jgi:nucleoside-diphosphate-sugar epimerase
VRTALVVGGTGLVGRAIARRLLTDGWAVTVTGRERGHLPADLAEARFVAAGRDDAAALSAAAGDGADLLVDCICYTARDADMLLPLARHAGSTVMISSKAVYVDDEGRHSNSPAPPHFAGPVTEEQPTMAPTTTIDHRSREGYGANKVAAEQVLLDSGLPVTVLRPSKIHGDGASNPREWYFVKRALDRRPVVVMAAHGAGVDHPTAAVNIAALVATVADRPGRRILNAADPDAPDGRAIARTISGVVGHEWREVPLGDDAPPELGRHPWHKVPPFVLDTHAALALEYRPVGNYATTVAPTVRALVAAPPEALDERRSARWFDYAAEDAWLTGSHRFGG